ncbi:MAG: hypothetical protein KBD07_02085 [Candidatus Omnitrophica bacterium]|jgi:predicted small lipoprotein YifL|nr:hypothetical protein [Candidatus Omnitrophota bacterium]
MKNLFKMTACLAVALTVAGCGQQKPQSSFKVENAAPEQAVKSTAKNMSDDMARALEVDMGGTYNEGSVAAPSQQGPAVENGVFRPFPIYTDDSSPDNHYFPSGWMGDYADVSFESAYLQNPHSGSTSIRIAYSNKATQGARWTGIYWQNPANNWGNRPGGYDLTGATKLTFWARGDKGGERLEEFKMGGMTGEYSDSDLAGIGPLVLTQEWKQYTIDLDGKDLSSITGGFAWAANIDNNPDGMTFYLDDIRYES